MANNLQETIGGILYNDFIGIPNNTIPEATEAILQAVRDVVPPEIKVDKNSNCVIGWNACRADMLEELGGGE